MERNSNVYFHAGLQSASLACYFLLAGKSQGYCSFTSIVTATALQYIRSNQVNDTKENLIYEPAIVTIAIGCLLSRTGVKVWGLTLAYFATAFRVIHYHRPKDEILPPPPPKRSEPVRVVPRPRTPPLRKKLKPHCSPNRGLSKMRGKTHTMQVLNLYYGRANDSSRRSFDDILDFKENDLRTRPDIVHWLFPAEFSIRGQEECQ